VKAEESLSSMDLSKNRIPEHVKKIHLIAVCGTGMGALASMLKDMGFEVTGSDRKIYPPMSSFLAQKGIKIADGFDEKNISSDTDLVVVGNAVSKDNIEVIKTDKMGLFFCSMPQALNQFIAAEKKQVIITGTHGKTTTSSMSTTRPFLIKGRNFYIMIHTFRCLPALNSIMRIYLKI
jgi:UDP-N-acetylmuramate: L-alanyl-gamma-D-glutamyl-meso-diaminopimelate ligase